MTKNLKITLIIAMLAVFCAASALFCALNTVKAESWRYSEEILSSYEFGSTFTVPDAVLSVGGKETEASFSVTLPNGSATTERKIKLDCAGKYSVKYTAVQESRVYSETCTFNVDYSAYYISGSTGTATYGKYDKLGANSQGLIVRLAKGETLNFTQLLSLSDLKDENNLIEGFITPDERGTADFDKLTLTITDARDSSVYVKIDINRWTSNNNGKQLSWVSAGGNGQDMVGVESASKIHINDNVGVGIDLSFVAQQTVNDSGHQTWEGKTADYAPDAKLFSLSFDNESKIARAQGKLICKLTDTSYFSDVWSGFKSDKVRLSLSASGYQGQTANFCLTEVFGVDLVGNEFNDEDAPELEIDYDGDFFPEAALNNPYRIPSAHAYDDYAGEVKVKVSVFYNYASKTPVTMGVSEGEFIPDRAGTYTVVYECEDYAGNSVRVLKTVHAGGKIEKLEAELPEKRVENAVLGEFVAVEAPIISGGSGNKTVMITVKSGDTVQEVESGFTPEETGEWLVTYTVKDYLGTEVSVSYTVTVKENEQPVLYGEPAFAPVYVAGGSYVLPEFYGYVAESGRLTKKLCSVKTEDADGVKTYSAGSSFVPSVSKSGDDVQISYFCGDYMVFSAKVPVIIAKEDYRIYQDRFFFGENFTISNRTNEGAVLDSGLMINFTNPSENSGWTFANAQLAEGFAFVFETYSNRSKFGGLELVCTDAENPSVSVSLKIDTYSTRTVLSCGDNVTEISDSLKSGKEVTISYKNGRFTFNNTNIVISETINGEKFTGFESGKFYFSFYAKDVKIGAGYRVQSVSGSIITSDEADYGSPIIVPRGDYGGYRTINSLYTVSGADCGDVFAPNVSVTVSVYDAAGNVISDVNGLKLENVSADRDYTVKLTEYGVYNVRYVAQEENWADNKKNFIAYITVADEIAPVIEITSGYTKEINVGETIILPDITVNDNLSAAENIKITKYVINSDGRFILLKGDSNSLTADKSGVYTIGIIATDEFGNTTTITMEVTVKGEVK